MAVQMPTNAKVLVNEFDLSTQFSSYDIAAPITALDSTRFGDTARRVIAGIGEGTITLGGFFDSATGAVDPRLSALKGNADVLLSIMVEANTFDTRAAFGEFLLADYRSPATLGQLVAVSATFQGDDGVDYGKVLANLSARTSTANGTSIDNTVSSSNGAVAILHITAASGTTPSLAAKLQHSTDNSVWSDLITFSASATANKERKTVTGTVNRYLRATWTITGTSPSFTFALVVARR